MYEIGAMVKIQDPYEGTIRTRCRIYTIFVYTFNVFPRFRETDTRSIKYIKKESPSISNPSGTCWRLTFANELSGSPTPMCSLCSCSCKKPPLRLHDSSLNLGSFMGISGRWANCGWARGDSSQFLSPKFLIAVGLTLDHLWPLSSWKHFFFNYFGSFLCFFPKISALLGFYWLLTWALDPLLPWSSTSQDAVQLNKLWPISAMARAPTCFFGSFPLPQFLLPLQLPQDSHLSVLLPLLSGLEALWSSLDLPGICRVKRNNGVWKGKAQSILSWVPRGGNLNTSNNYTLPVVLHNRKKLGSSTESQGGSCQCNFPSFLTHLSCLYVNMWQNWQGKM